MTIVLWGLYWGPLILGNYHIYIYIDMSDQFRSAAMKIGKALRNSMFPATPGEQECIASALLKTAENQEKECRATAKEFAAQLRFTAQFKLLGQEIPRGFVNCRRSRTKVIAKPR